MKDARLQQPPRTIADPTDARQGSSRRMNLRVLIGSMLGAILIGAVLVGAFWRATPPGMDGRPVVNETPAKTVPPASSPAEKVPPPSQTTAPY